MSSSFDLLHDGVRRWIWDQGWSELRDVQEQAIRAITGNGSADGSTSATSDGNTSATRDVIIAATTAAGKTEAAFLPIASLLAAGERKTGVQALYVGPLKALINDQWRRLDGLCDSLGIEVHRWHGDVAAGARQKVLRDPAGVLLITPESLEALFVRRGSELTCIFAALQFVVIDELHAFIGNERGMQLQSLLHRLECVLRRRVRRVGLSATLGDMSLAADFLRPPNGRAVAPLIVQSHERGSGVKLRLYGFRRSSAEPLLEDEENGDETTRSIALHLFRKLRGSNNLVFANARRNVERYTDLLARTCEAARLPQEFFAHHGSLSRELRVGVEEALKDGGSPMTVLCTSTLEMGIDIGAVTSVAQIGPPPSVASLRQRLGRSGRRGEPAILRVYVEEAEVTERSPIQEAIRADLVQTIAMIELLGRKWVEPPLEQAVHGSTLVQQILSLIAQYGGITAGDAYELLCVRGPFTRVPRPMFLDLLRSLGARELIAQMQDGLLIHGAAGEKRVNHYDFYTAFTTADEYRLVHAGRSIGTLPVFNPLAEGSFLIFGGRRWRVAQVDDGKRVIDLLPAAGGRVPVFDTGGAGHVHDRVRAEMYAIYLDAETPPYLDAPAAALLHEGRDNFRRHGLDRTSYLSCAGGALYFPWYGTLAMNTLVRQLAMSGVEASVEGPAIVADRLAPDELRAIVESCEAESPVDTFALAAAVGNKKEEKWDWALDEATLCASYASRNLVERRPYLQRS